MRREFPAIAVSLVESGGGVFEVSLDGALVFSKRALKRHAEPGEVAALIRRHQEARPGA